MQVQQLSVKIFAQEGATLDQGLLIPIFHRWIREKRIENKLLFDVADYRHVPDGPGVMLICHECHYGLEETGSLGLTLNMKRDTMGDSWPKLYAATRDVLFAAHALTQEPALAGKLSFRTDRLHVRVLSRLAAENDQSGRAALGPDVYDLAEILYPGAKHELHWEPDERKPLGVIVDFGQSVPLETLLDRMA